MFSELKIMLLVTAAAGLIPVIFILLRLLLIRLFWKKAEGRLTGVAIASLVLKRGEDGKLPEGEKFTGRALVEFDAGGETKQAVSRFDYDDEELPLAFKAPDRIELRYKRRTPERDNILKGEFRRRVMPFIIGDAFVTLSAIAAEVMVFTYMGRMHR